MKKRIGILFLIISVLVWIPISLNTASVSGTPSESWHFTATGPINAVAISADGNYIVAGTSDNYLYLFEKGSSTPLWNFSASDSINSVAISADGSYIIAGSENNNVYFFDQSINTPNLPAWSYEASFSIESVVISANGTQAAASDLEHVYCFNTTNISSPKTWDRFTAIVKSIAISADGRYLVVGDSINSITFYNTTDVADPFLWTYRPPAPLAWDFNDVAISSDGEYIVAGSQSNRVYLLNKTVPAPSKRPLWFNDTDNEVRSVDISSDGGLIVSGNAQGNFSLFNKSTSLPLWSHSVCDVIISVAISNDGSYVAYSGNLSSGESVVFVFNSNNPSPLFSYNANQSGIVQSLAISANGRYVVVGTSGVNDCVYLFEVYPVSGGVNWLLVGGVVIVVGGTAGGLAGLRRSVKKRRRRKKRKLKVVSGPGTPLSPIEILKEVGHKNSLLNKFQEAKTTQSISPIKSIVLTSISASFVEKAGKLGLDPLELRDFLEEMLGLPPVERNDIIDRMLLVSGGAD